MTFVFLPLFDMCLLIYKDICFLACMLLYGLAVPRMLTPQAKKQAIRISNREIGERSKIC